MATSDGKRDLEALKGLLDSAREIADEIVHGSTQRAMRALAAIPPDERSLIATALEHAAVAWQQSEAFNTVNQVRLRANPNAQLFVRVFDDVPDPAPQDFDLLPEAVRIMRRIGVSMHPELRAVWEPALLGALEVVTPAERANCVRFLERVLSLVAAAPVVEPAPADEVDERAPETPLRGTKD
jgi:hypothetical protein